MSRIQFSSSKTQVVGTVGKDPRLNKDGSICDFSVATEHWAGKEKGNVTTWWKVVFFGDSAAKIASNISKGDKVYASGRAYVNEWKSDNGPRYDLCISADDVVPFSWAGGQKREEEDLFGD